MKITHVIQLCAYKRQNILRSYVNSVAAILGSDHICLRRVKRTQLQESNTVYQKRKNSKKNIRLGFYDSPYYYSLLKIITRHSQLYFGRTCYASIKKKKNNKKLVILCACSQYTQVLFNAIYTFQKKKRENRIN